MSDGRQLMPVAIVVRSATLTVWNVMRLRRRIALLAVVLATVTAGFVMNWTMLVALSIAPLLISALPRAIMCVLGLCMGMGRSSCATETVTEQSTTATPDRAQVNSMGARSPNMEPFANLAGLSGGEPPAPINLSSRKGNQPMRKPWRTVAVASALAAAALTVSTFYADSTQGQGGPMMDHGGMMGRGGMMGGRGQTGQMMDHCSQMMGGGPARPNEQWRKETPKTPEKKG